MSYEMSLGSFFAGFLILVAGVVFVRYYQWVADNFGDGFSSYDRYRLFALLTCLLGLIVMVNLHTVFLTWFVSIVFHR